MKKGSIYHEYTIAIPGGFLFLYAEKLSGI